MGELGSVGEGLFHVPHGGSQWKRVLGSKLFIVENGCIPTSQSGPEIKYLLQGRMSGKGNLLARPSGALGTSLA